jgi:hypothetical protein
LKFVVHTTSFASGTESTPLVNGGWVIRRA